MSYSKKNLRLTLFVIILIALFSFLVDYHVANLNGGEDAFKVPDWVPVAGFWNSFDYHLGLDLKGGTHLVYEADTSQVARADRDSAVAGVRDVIERRVNAFGVSEPLVQTNKDQESNYRIIVELAGVRDVNQAIEMIGETPLLEFKEQNPEALEERELTEQEKQELATYNQQAGKQAEEINQRALAGENFDKLAKEFSEDPGSKDNGGSLGWARRGDFVVEFEKAIFDELEVGEITPKPIKTDFGYHIIKKMDERQFKEPKSATSSDELLPQEGEPKTEVLASHILIRTKSKQDILSEENQWKNTELSGEHLNRAVVTYSQNTNDPQVSLEFNDEGAELFEKITARNIGNPVAIFLDGEPISVPNVNEKITGGRAVITGRFNLKEAKDLVQRLNAGALPVPIKLVSQQTVGPTLGARSVDKSLTAGLYGLLAVALFMILFYRLPGVLAVLALSIYTLIVLAIFKILSVTLTLAGIAGFILSIGLAVDANVLIFERLKEELRRGKSFSTAVEIGFKRAWTSIRDSNMSTLITCAILYWFGTSIIRGFAVTLAIGIMISMFSAIVISRSFLRLLSNKLMDKFSWLIKR